MATKNRKGPAEPDPANVLAEGGESRLAPGLRLQILTTEHWSLLSTRSLSWNEAFSRATMFLSVLSGAVVALALVAQATGFDEGFTTFAILILPVVRSSASRRSCASSRSTARTSAGWSG